MGPKSPSDDGGVAESGEGGRVVGVKGGGGYLIWARIWNNPGVTRGIYHNGGES